MSVSTGDRFRVITPEFTSAFGQGDLPGGFSLNLDGETLFLKHGQTFEADSGLTELSAEIGGTLYVRADVVERLLTMKSTPIRKIKRVKNG